MQILVTGGCGFIGSHLVDRLIADGHRVTVLDDLSSGSLTNLHPSATHVAGDVADAAQLAALTDAVDAVFHLAAIASVDICEREPEKAERTNVQGTEAVFAAAAMRQIPVIYASSAAVYGDNPALPLSETEVPRPLGAYGRHKQENEQTAARYAGQVPSVGLRFFNVYGPRQDPRSPYSGVISKFSALAREGLPLTLHGDGEQTRDFIYVGDIVTLLVASLAHVKTTHILNGCTGHATSLNQLAETIGQVLNRPLVITHTPPRAGDIRHSRGNPARATAELGFTATTPLKTGLAQLLAQ